MDRRLFLAGAVAAPVLRPAPAPGSPHPASTGESLRDGRLVLPVLVNGSGPFRMIVDTAANRSVLSEGVVRLLGLQEIDRIVVNTVAGAETIGRVHVATVQAGSLQRTNLLLPVGTAAGLGADGLLGSDLLHDHRAIFTFAPKPSVVIEPSRDVRTGLFTGRRRIRLSRSIPPRMGGLVVVDGDAGGRPFQAILDSGAAKTVVSGSLARAAGAIPDEAVVNSEVRSVTGQTMPAVPMVLRQVRLGGVHLGRISIDVADVHTFGIFGGPERPMMLLGMDAFRRFDRLVVDFGRRQLIVDL